MSHAALADAPSPPAIGPQALRYKVKGMDCPTCAGKIETAVSRLPGVTDVRVNYSSQVLDLALDEAATPRTEIEGRIERLGYGVAPLLTAADLSKAQAAGVAPTTEAEEAEPPLWRSQKASVGILIGALFVAGFVVERIAPGLAGEYAYWPGALVGLAYYGRRAVVAALNGTPFSIEMLMSVATAGALAIHAAEEAAIVVLLFTVGEMLEVVAAGRARAGIKALAALVPKTARLVDAAEGTIREVPAASLTIGQIVVVRPGDRVPADGLITDGSSSLDESPITGESVPRAKEVGDPVYAGSVNADGALQVQVTKTAADNTVARILHLVEEAQASKSPHCALHRSVQRGLHAHRLCVRCCRCAHAADPVQRRLGHLDLPGACAPPHRLPLRARALDAGRYRVGSGRGRAARTSREGRCGAGDHRASAHGGVRQDGDPDGGPAAGHRHPDSQSGCVGTVGAWVGCCG